MPFMSTLPRHHSPLSGSPQVSLFSKRLLLVPVHQEVHWCLVAAEPARRTVRLYDSSECVAPAEVALVTASPLRAPFVFVLGFVCFHGGGRDTHTQKRTEQRKQLTHAAKHPWVHTDWFNLSSNQSINQLMLPLAKENFDRDCRATLKDAVCMI